MGACTSVPHPEESIADENRDATPSFALLDVQGPVIVTYVYQLVDGEVCSSLVILTCPSAPRTRPYLIHIPGPSSSASRLAPDPASTCVHPAPLISDAI
jgi:hypothetical protein